MLLLTPLSIFSQTWEYFTYQPKQEGSKSNIRFINLYQDSLLIFSPGTVPDAEKPYFTCPAVELFNLNTSSFSDFFTLTVGEGMVDMQILNSEGIWILGNKNIYGYSYSENSISLKDNHLEGIKPPEWNYTSFYKDKENRLLWGYGDNLYCIEDDSVTYKNVSEFGMSGKLFYYDPIVRLGDTYYLDDVHNDSVFAVNLNNNEVLNRIGINQFGIADTAHIEQMVDFGSKILMYVVHSSGPSVYFKEFFLLENDEISKIKFDFTEEPCDFYKINAFCRFSDDLIAISVKYTIDGILENRIILSDLNGNTIKDILPPEFPEESNGNTLAQPVGLGRMVTIDEAIYMAIAAGSKHSGIFKLEPFGSSVESEVEGIVGNSVWIFNTYPNPSRGMTKVDFFCMPEHLKEMTVKVYDVLGNEYPVSDYKIINFNTANGKGTLQVDLSKVPSGAKYILLSANNHNYGKGVMKY
jgi:hypothetical protein